MKGNITILFNRYGLEIEVRDDSSRTKFLKILLNEEQTLLALSRLAETECEIEVFKLERVGKIQEIREIEFEIDLNLSKRKENAKKMAKELCPVGWVPDLYFDSQGSFFMKDEKSFARTTIRRWI